MYGDGLTSGVIDGTTRIFHVNTGNMAGDLTVQMSGPKGGFAVKKSRDVGDDRVLNVEYTPTTAGDYIVNVLWMGVHIEGSPKHLSMKNS